jgi:hypothetical protein
VLLFDWDDILEQLGTLVSSDERWLRQNGLVDLFGGLFAYRMVQPDKCGSDGWRRLRQILAQPGPPHLLSCVEAASVMVALLRVSGEDKVARCRLIQLGDTAHAQVVSRGQILDPSVRLGMPIPKGMEYKIFDVSFTYEDQ